MISKIIHYCWFGKQKMSSLEEDCLDSWTRNLPDFQFRLWNEESIDLDQYPFAKEAYLAGKFAFVSDVVRLHALYLEGGVYLDTDMMLIKNLEGLLHLSFFAGQYVPGALNAAVIGSEASHPIIKELLDFYRFQNFEFLNPLTIPEVFDQVLWKHQGEGVQLFSSTYFYPLPMENKGEDFARFIRTETFGVHLWNHSWKDEFVLLKENRFLGSLSLAMKHVIKYPKAYRNSGYLNLYFTLLIRNLKRYVKLKLSEYA